MNDKFDHLAKGIAQSVTRREALKKFGFGIAGIALAALGLATKAEADPKPTSPCLGNGSPCHSNNECCSGSCVVLHGGEYTPKGKFCLPA